MRNNWKYESEYDEWYNMDKFIQVKYESLEGTFYVKAYETLDSDGIILYVTEDLRDEEGKLIRYARQEAERWMNEFMRQ